MFTRNTKQTVSDADMQKLVQAANVLHAGDPITLKEVELKPRLARFLLDGASKQLANARMVKEKKAKPK